MGFNKINLSSSIEDSAVSSDPPEQTSNRKFKFGFRKKWVIIALALIIASSIALSFPAYATYKSAKKTYVQAQVTLAAIKQQNIVLAGEELEKTKKDLEDTQKKLNYLVPLKFAPIAAWYYNDAQHLVKAGGSGLDAARILIDSVEPYADVLGLKGQGSFVMGSAENRIQTAVTTMSKVTPGIDDIEKHLLLAKEEIDEVSPNHYPPILGLGKVRNNLITLRKAADEGITFVSEAKPLIRVLPELLGASEEKKYLILFQNDKEIRPTGGFITAYSVFSVDKGRIVVERSDNIYNLDKTISGKPVAPAPIKKYLPNVPVFNLRDTNLSPDFIESMKTFNSLYDKARGGAEVDGIIALDTSVLVSTIKILDDSVSAGGMTFTTKIDKRCDCPQVIYELEKNVSTPLSLDLRVSDLEAIQAGRKAIIGELLYAIMQKALKSSPKVYWGPLFQDMVAQIDQKHILINLYDTEAQRGIRAVNADGKILPFEGDYLHINEANFGGAKSNLFVKKSVSQDYKIENDGSIVKTVTINWKNPYPASDCNLERGNLCLNAVFRDWLRIYVPAGSTLVDSKGSEVKLTSYEELGKTVFEGFMMVRPQGSATFTISYKLPFSFPEKDALLLLIQKQPGTYSEEYEIKVGGKKAHKFELLTDKQVKIEK